MNRHLNRWVVATVAVAVEIAAFAVWRFRRRRPLALPRG
jgi:hypothetical protein